MFHIRNKMSFHTFVVITVLVFLLTVQPYEATRILDEEEEQWMKRGQNLLLPSFQRGSPTGPPAPSGCTWVGGSGGKPCTASIGNRNFAGQSAADAYPKEMVRFGVAAQTK